MSRIIRDFPPGALPAIRNQVRGNAKQPCGERNSAPLKSFEVGQCLVKYLGCQVFGFDPVSHPPHNVGVHALKVDFVELGKAGGVLLRSFDQKPLVRFFLQSLQRVLRGLALHKGNAVATRKVTGKKNSTHIFFDVASSAASASKLANSGSIYTRLQLNEANEVTYGNDQWSIQNPNGCRTRCAGRGRGGHSGRQDYAPGPR